MIWGILLAAAIMIAAYSFFLHPAKVSPGELKQLTGRSYAQRGLHSQRNGVPENTLKAFEVALNRGYGVAMDVRISRDGEAMVFHDETLMRLCHLSNMVEDVDSSQLKKLRILDSDQFIPTLEEALKLIGGKVPVILELKKVKDRKALCRKVAEILDAYEGAVCVASFDIMTLHWFKRNRKEIPRMQEAMNQKFVKKNPVSKYVEENLMGNFLSRPHIVAYEHDFSSNRHFKRCINNFGAAGCVFTVTDQNTFDNMTKIASIILFERIFPKQKYDNTIRMVRGQPVRND